ncbi:MAG: hypothetical protein ACT4OY_03765 [Alphaproteobacteria bacterium]
MKKFVFIVGLAVFLLTPVHKAAAERESKIDSMFGTKKQETEEVPVISVEDQALITTYLEENYASQCVTPLQKKRSSCRSTMGQPKKYVIGERVRAGLYSSAPADLVSDLTKLPKGYRYVRVDKDILLINDKTKIPLAAVTLTPESTSTDVIETKKTYKSKIKLTAEE